MQRLSQFGLLVALVVGLAACDNSVEPEVTGPTIQFGAASQAAAESDGTIQIPVTLTGGTAGQTYTVEVLYAAGASTVVFGSDFTDFGTEDGANRIATVTLTGPEDTQTVAVTLVDDGVAESSETAVFVLQRATGGAAVGANRQFELQVGTPPISVIRTRAVGDVVTVEGIMTRARGRYSFIQDDSGAALTIFAGGGAFFDAIASGAVAQGDRVQVVGTLNEFRGLLQIAVTEFVVQSRGNTLPAAQTVTVAQLLGSGDEYEGEIVRITGLTLSTTDVVFAASRNYDATDATGTAIMRTQRNTDSAVVDQVIADLTGGTPGAYGPFTFTGPVGQFDGTNQLQPVELTDIQMQ